MFSFVVFVLFLTSSFKLTTTASPRIIGGQNASIEDYPYNLMLASENVDCNAFLISPTWALTSAQCVLVYKIFQGSIYANSSSLHQGINVEVEEAITHPNYSIDHFDQPTFDIGLLKFASSVNCANCKPISLSETGPDVGDIITMTGWGSTSKFSTKPSEVLQVVRIPVVERKICDESYPEIDNGNSFCAYLIQGDEYLGAAGLDAGSPAVVEGEVVGVFSMAYASEGYPGIYSDIGKFRQWIRDIAGV